MAGADKEMLVRTKSTLPIDIDIIEACRDARLLNIPLSLGQETLLRALYGLSLNQEQLDLYCRATGRSSYTPGFEQREGSVICGRRAGKSSRICSSVALYESCFRPRPQLAPGETASVIVLAPVQKQASITFKYISSRIHESPLLRTLIRRERADELELTNNAAISVWAANHRWVRGLSVAACIAEELCFWYEDDGSPMDVESVLRAVRPALATLGGKLLKVSSPWAKSGPLYQDWQRRDRVFAWKLASPEMNPSLPKEFLDSERERDPEAFAREFGAEFLEAASALLPAEAVEAAVVKGQVERMPSSEGHVFALDAAFKSDSFALAGCHVEGERAIVDLAKHWKPQRGKAVQFAPVLGEIVETMKRFQATQIYGDQVCSEPIKQTLAQYGIQFEQTTTLGRRASAIYSTLRAKLIAGQLELPDNPELISQLKRLELIVGSSGSQRVEASSGHDDLAVAVALAVFKAVSQPVVKPWVGFFRMRPDPRGSLGNPAPASVDDDGVVWHSIL